MNPLAFEADAELASVTSEASELEKTSSIQESTNSANSERESFDFDIDRRINEALELAEKVRAIDCDEDDLDVPAFLRQNTENFNLP